MLQGGAGGAARALRQFSPDRIADWSHNHYPEMTAELIAAFDAQTREMSRGRSLEEWEQERDEFLIRALQVRTALRQETRHAGAGPGDDGHGGVAG
jgi:hypothetical protein